MITVMSALVAGLATVAAAVGLRALRLPRDARGPAALTLGLVAGWVVLAASGYALTLITIYLLFALGCGLVGALCGRLRLPMLVRLAGVGVLAAALFAFEYRHGDMYALASGIWWIVAIVSVFVLTFFGRLPVAPAPASGAAAEEASSWASERALMGVALVGFAWYAVVAYRLPNPGLLTLSLVAFVALGCFWLVAQVWGLRLGDAGVTGLAGLMFALGLYAWMADASVPMAAAPLVLVAADVAVTLLGRLASGRALAGGQRTWVGRVLGVLEPRDDAGWQLNIARLGAAPAAWLLVAFTLVSIAIAAATWVLLWASVTAAIPLVVLAVVYLAASALWRRVAVRRGRPARPATSPA